MRIHTNIESWQQIHAALDEQKNLGRIALHVSFKTLDEHRSSIRPHAFEVQLEADERDSGRRAGNSGSYGTMRPEADGYAATYDEWGWLLAALYELDRDMVVGTPKYPTYSDAADFHHSTAWTYDPERLLDALEHGDDPFPFVTGKAANTKRGYVIGRRGADRWNGVGRAPRRHKERDRTIAEVQAFAYPFEVTA